MTQTTTQTFDREAAFSQVREMLQFGMDDPVNDIAEVGRLAERADAAGDEDARERLLAVLMVMVRADRMVCAAVDLLGEA